MLREAFPQQELTVAAAQQATSGSRPASAVAAPQPMPHVAKDIQRVFDSSLRSMASIRLSRGDDVGSVLTSLRAGMRT
jgi:hypothetical protein